MSIITSLHRPAQLYARLNMHSYRAGLTALILTFILGAVSNSLSFFVYYSSMIWTSQPLEPVDFIMSGIMSFPGIITFILAGSVILGLIFRHVMHEHLLFSVPFTIVSISNVPFYLLSLCDSWLFLMILFDPLNIIPTGYVQTIGILLTFVVPIAQILIFCWYMARGILATTKIRVRYTVLIAVITLVITGFVQDIIFLVRHFWLNM